MSAFDFSNAFATTEAHSPSGGMLRKGKHIVRITEVDGTGTSSGGFPTIDLRVENGEGYQRDRLFISPKEFAIAKIMGLVMAAGLERPTSDDVNSTDGRLRDVYLSRLQGKTVGIVVDDEPDRDDPSKMWARVKGYVDAAQLGSEIPADTAGLRSTVNDPLASKASLAETDDIPF